MSLTSMVSPQKNWLEQQEQLSQNPLKRKEKNHLKREMQKELLSTLMELVRAVSKFGVTYSK